jgi:hypothetical protein
MPHVHFCIAFILNISLYSPKVVIVAGSSEASALRKSKCFAPMDAAARAPTPPGAHKMMIAVGESRGRERAWRWPPEWRSPARAKAVVVVGFWFTMALLVLVFCGGSGAGSLPASFSSSRTEFLQKPGNIVEHKACPFFSFSCAHVFDQRYI